MKKRILILSMVLVIVLSVVFTACNKDVYINPVNNEKYILVTDENGGKVLSEDGELLVYVTDEHGKKVKDDNGEYLTEIHGFIGQIEQDGVVEDYAYYFTLPDGWKFVRDTGDFEKKSKKYSLKITIEDETFNDYYSSVGIFAKGLSSASDELEHEYGTKAEWYELDYENVDTKVCLAMIKSNDVMTSTMFFSVNQNLYVLRMSSSIDSEFSEIKKEMIKIYEALEFKPYTYYEGLTDTPVESEESTLV